MGLEGGRGRWHFGWKRFAVRHGPVGRERLVKVAVVIFAALLAAGAARCRRRLSRGTLVLAVAVVLGLAAYGAGVLHPPNLEHVITGMGASLGPYMYLVVGVLAFAETGAGLGLVAPGELAVIVGGVAAGQGEIKLVPLIAIVWVAALAGDLTSYGLGRRFGRGLMVRHGPRIGLSDERLRRVDHFYAAHGGKTIIVGRFVSLVRPILPLVAGASGLPARRFIAYTTAAAGLWAATFCTLGYVFSRSLDQIAAVSKHAGLALAGVVLLAAAVIAAHRRWRPPPPERSDGDGTAISPRGVLSSDARP
jgi:membrane protein DedA with SNARE-associated domain